MFSLRTLILATIAVCAMSAEVPDAKAFVNAMTTKYKTAPVGDGPSPHCMHDPGYASCMMDFGMSGQSCMEGAFDCVCIGDTISKLQGCLRSIDCYGDYEKREYCEGAHEVFALMCPGSLPDC